MSLVYGVKRRERQKVAAALWAIVWSADFLTDMAGSLVIPTDGREQNLAGRMESGTGFAAGRRLTTMVGWQDAPHGSGLKRGRLLPACPVGCWLVGLPREVEARFSKACVRYQLPPTLEKLIRCRIESSWPGMGGRGWF